jgi:cytochrome P450
MRRIVGRGFTPPRIKEMATAIEEIVERCLAEIEHQPDGRGQGFPKPRLRHAS